MKNKGIIRRSISSRRHTSQNHPHHYKQQHYNLSFSGYIRNRLIKAKEQAPKDKKDIYCIYWDYEGGRFNISFTRVLKSKFNIDQNHLSIIEHELKNPSITILKITIIQDLLFLHIFC